MIERWLCSVAILLAVLIGHPLSASSQSSQQRRPPVRITLLHLSNVSQFSPIERGTQGGLARVTTLRKNISTDSPNNLFLFGGDTISPSVESNSYKGQQMIDAWNAVGLDYAVLGNHEFDFGPDVLHERIKESRFVWLGANVVDKRTGKPFADTPPFVIREFEGVRVGIIGLVLPETKSTSRPGDDLDFLNACETAKRIIPQMRSAGAAFIIALSHLTMVKNKELARCAPQINLIISGGEHDGGQAFVAGQPIFNIEADARHLGRIDLYLSPDESNVLQSMEWEMIPVTDEVPDDPVFTAAMQRYVRGIMAELDKVVGRTNVQLDARSSANRTRETNIGSFIADAFRQVTGADVGLINGGSIRADRIITPGELTRRDLLSILPFANPVVKLEVSGATLRAALEHGVSQSLENDEPGRFPQVSGMRFIFSGLRPAGSRVVGLTVNGQPLDDRKVYTLATSTFLAIDSGDGYDMFRGARLLIRPEEGAPAPEILRKAISSVPTIAPRTDGRIRRLDEDMQSR